MREVLDCTIDDVDAKGRSHCACTLVTATGGECRQFGPPPTLDEAFPYLRPFPTTADQEADA